MKEAAVSILSRAVELDQNQRFTEALLLYQEGIQILLNLRKSEPGEKSNYYLMKIEEYMTRAENIKRKVDELKKQGKYHEQINIVADSTGHSYTTIFSRFLDSDVTNVVVEDPYVRAYHQVQNFIKFTEMLIKHCKNIKTIKLVTTQGESDQQQMFDALTNDLQVHFKVALSIQFSTTLHDRQIMLNNGWIIKIGRGLDYFKAPRSRNCIGFYDLDLRPCHETTVDIFHSNSVIHK